MVRRARPVRERIVPTVVERLTREFKYPETDPGPQGVNILGGGGGAPTIVVAAADASDFSKSKADILCTGIGDADRIKQALDLIDTGTGLGGRVLLTEGTFICEANVIRIADNTGQSPSTLAGMGNSTVLQFTTAGVGIDLNADGASVRDLRLYGDFAADNAIATTPGTNRWILESLWIDSFNDSAIGLASGNREWLITKVLMGTTIGQVLNGIEIFTDADQGSIQNCYFRTDEDAVLITGIGHTDLIISNNIMEPDQHGIHLSSAAIEGIEMIGNVIRPGDKGVFLDGGGVEGIIARNTIIDAGDNAIDIDGQSARVVVSDNMIVTADQHGIRVNDSGDCAIHDNYIYQPGQSADNTFDGIHLAGDSDRNYIHGNKIIGAAAAPQPRYAINISASTCDCNIVVGNDLGDPADYGTDALNDAGTDTQLFYPSDGTYGDNVTSCPPDSS